MGIRRILMAILGLSGIAYGLKPLSTDSANKYVSRLNFYRRNVKPSATDMQEIHYSFAKQAKIDKLLQQHGGSWVYQPFGTSNWGDYEITRQGWNGYYVPLLIDEPTWAITWHDTCRSHTEKCLFDNLHYRVDQQNQCYDYNHCNATVGSYNRFMSCDNGPTQFGAHTTCSYVFNYWPRFIMANITEIACAVLNTPGPGDKHQRNSYWCWGEWKNPKTDKPYEAGPWGAKCNKGVSNKLCI